MAMNLVSVMVVVLVAAQRATAAGLCSGLELHVEQVQACDGTQSFFTFDKGPNATLDENCVIATSGCVSYKSFGIAKITYDLKYDTLNPVINSFVEGVPLMSSGTIDFCRFLTYVDSRVTDEMKKWGLFYSCPVKETTVCSSVNTTYSIDWLVEKFNFFFQIATSVKQLTGRLTVDHGTGKTCVDFAGAIRKKVSQRGIFQSVQRKLKKKWGRKTIQQD